MAMWDENRAYAKVMLAEIRAHDPDAIVIVGTPFWSQRADVAALDPLVVDSAGAPVGNVAYTIHAYAGQHREAVRAYADSALARGVALVMTECGRVGTDWGPDNTVDSVSFRAWTDWMDRNSVSYCKWSLSTKDERSSSLRPAASVAGGWTDDELTAEGRWNRAWFRAQGKQWARGGGEGLGSGCVSRVGHAPRPPRLDHPALPRRLPGDRGPLLHR